MARSCLERLFYLLGPGQWCFARCGFEMPWPLQDLNHPTMHALFDYHTYMLKLRNLVFGLLQAADWTAADRYSTAALHSMTLLIGMQAHPVLESFYQAACRAKMQNGDAAGADILRRQYLTGMVRLNQRHGRQPPGGRGNTGAASGRGQVAATTGGPATGGGGAKRSQGVAGRRSHK